ncbi:hypothetical protein BCR32DRAFT_294258 [Anaeromyces robustus]|uniref:Dynactin subunit 4 n=1 Tax=Anaeromyces robustus TaxID=1754192 RepID=A0A1Y1X2Y0_9FUNG|nr:hypothetical protein BCR32DRAFT_294258 [Anaeromyces robustus]|eukprot:ORX79756.1 hypothetical protein BCR32DRAFT_294258 [Anaeromyces robustus]
MEHLNKNNNKNNIPFPYVYYQCTCQVVSKIRRDIFFSTNQFPLKEPVESEINSTTISHFPPTHFNHYRLKSIYNLYFCPSCCEIHCPDCVKNDFLCFYCPNCLFDVPQASVVSEQNRCIRNCFECPVCFNVLTVVSQKDVLPTSASTSSITDEQNSYYLACNVCQWKSLEIDLSFDKSTGLYLQLQKKESVLPHEVEFQNLRNYYDKCLRSNSNMNSINTKRLSALFGNSSSLLISPSIISHIPDLKTKLILAKRENNQKSDEYNKTNDNQDSTILMEDELEMIRLKNLENMEELTSLEQKLNQPEDQPKFLSHLRIHRIPLRVKLQTKCNKCEKILIKQEIQKMKKPSNIRFAIKCFARDYIPNIFIQQLIPNKPLYKDMPVQVLLKFVNPLSQEIQVSLTTLPNKQNENENKSKPKIDTDIKKSAPKSPMSPIFGRRTSSLMASPKARKRGPSLKISTAPIIPTKIKEEQYKKSEGVSSCNVTVLAKNFKIPAYDPLKEFENETEPTEQKQVGIFEKKKNSVSIVVEVRPTGNVNDRVEFPILVTYSFVNDQKEVDNETPISPNYAELSHGVQKFVSFWTVIGIGKIVEENIDNNKDNKNKENKNKKK